MTQGKKTKVSEFYSSVCSMSSGRQCWTFIQSLQLYVLMLIISTLFSRNQSKLRLELGTDVLDYSKTDDDYTDVFQ